MFAMFPGLFGKLWRRVRYRLEPRPETIFPLRRPLPLPDGVSEADLRRFVSNVRPAGSPEAEMARYAEEDFERFVLTWDLTRGLTGDCLELGANPYFTTMLLARFTPLRLTLANYFGPWITAPTLDQVVHCDGNTQTFTTHHFNIEQERFPFADGAFNVVLCCEILEHLQHDPLAAFTEIHRVLKSDGTLIVTTPNVARLENVARLIAGENIYDPYSGYGPYGRHNREYTLSELRRLLEHAGFTIDVAFTADVHGNHAAWFAPLRECQKLLQRAEDLGQYLFVRARKAGIARAKKPAWLYRSYPAGEME
jgi:SAM-dependent methyltransferase